MTAFVGALEPFVGMDFTPYAERLESFYVANDIGVVVFLAADTETIKETKRQAADKKKTAVMISMIGKEAYDTLKDLCLPEKPVDKSFTELCELMKDHFISSILVVAESYKFHKTFQGENESISDFTNRLKRATVYCEFGEFLGRALRDQFIMGISNNNTRTKLLSAERTFDEAFKIAKANEAAEKESIYVNLVPKDYGSVNQVEMKKMNFPRKQRACFRCGDLDHWADKCRHAETICNFCGKLGHLTNSIQFKNLY